MEFAVSESVMEFYSFERTVLDLGTHKQGRQQFGSPAVRESTVWESAVSESVMQFYSFERPIVDLGTRSTGVYSLRVCRL